jgi:hypothetical protein
MPTRKTLGQESGLTSELTAMPPRLTSKERIFEGYTIRREGGAAKGFGRGRPGRGPVERSEAPAGGLDRCRQYRPGQTDSIAATGKAKISGGTVDALAACSVFSGATRYALLTAHGGVSGTFASLTTASNLAFLTPTLSSSARDVFLILTTFPATPVSLPSVAQPQIRRRTPRPFEVRARRCTT